MRLIRLTMCGFGAFAETQTIFFDKLSSDGIFLISGDTGSGKTTIFDAISFALFGQASGQNRQKDFFRSGYVKEDVKTFVELEFEHHKNRYIVNRSPSYERISKRAKVGFVTEKGDAILIKSDGNVTGFKEVTAKIVDLLRVDWLQFKQIAMIAQGEFMKLLIATTKERGEILQKAFNTQKYANFQVKVLKKFDDVKNQYEEIEKSIKQYIGDIRYNQQIDTNDMNNQELLELLGKIIEEDKEQQFNLSEKDKKLDIDINSYIAQIESCKYINKQFEILKNDREKFIKLKQNENIINQNKIDLEKSKKALYLIKPIVDKQNIAKDKLDKAQKNNEYVCDNIKKNQQAKEKILLNIETNKQKQTQIEQLEETVDKAEKDLPLLEKLDKAESNLKKLTNEYNSLKENLKVKQNNFNKAQILFYSEQAAILAEKLEEGIACPVCGSIHHPNKAKRKNVSITEQEVNNLKNELETINKDFNKINIKYVEKQKEISMLRKTVNIEAKEDIVKLKLKLQEEIKTNKKLIKEYLDFNSKLDISLRRCENNLSKLDGTKAELEKSIVELLDEIKQSELEYEKYLESSSLSKEEYAKYLKTDKEIENIQKKIDYFNNEYLKLSDAILRSENNLKDKQYKDITNMENNLDSLKLEKNNLIKQLNFINTRLELNQNIRINLIQKFKQQEKLKTEYSNLKILAETANGRLLKKEKIAFEQYVQSFYFKKIVQRANLHFKKMSYGQFELRCKEKAADMKSNTGLDLEVMDFYTQKLRSVSSLSGGESFKAALSLALSLADIIQSTAGGVEIEAMFIDEGFGSLDANSLDQAIDTLMQLSNNKCMIGIISHVSELKERIDKKIEVKKTPYGSKIEVKV